MTVYNLFNLNNNFFITKYFTEDNTTDSKIKISVLLPLATTINYSPLKISPLHCPQYCSNTIMMTAVNAQSCLPCSPLDAVDTSAFATIVASAGGDRRRCCGNREGEHHRCCCNREGKRRQCHHNSSAIDTGCMGSAVNAICTASAIDAVCMGSGLDAGCTGRTVNTGCTGSAVDAGYTGSIVDAVCTGSAVTVGSAITMWRALIAFATGSVGAVATVSTNVTTICSPG